MRDERVGQKSAIKSPSHAPWEGLKLVVQRSFVSVYLGLI
jgi:hypothetical protein